MGVRIGRTPRNKRGCWLFGLVLLGVPALALTLTACPGGTGTPPADKSKLEANAYRQCVGTDRGKTAQSRCQLHVWGQTFGEEDPRWVCDRMGNWQCSPTEEKL